MGDVDHASMLHGKSNRALLARLPERQKRRVFKQEMCDIGDEFLGFVGIYEKLAQIVPPHWTVVDLGCAYAPQAVLFENHRAYIGVDFLAEERFSAKNTTHYKMTIGNFIAKHAAALDKSTTFAICSYVPPWHGDNRKIARETFPNLFTFYPAGGRTIAIKVKSRLTSAAAGSRKLDKERAKRLAPSPSPKP